jgi:DNA-directed RNA polymerase specialized sigma24 family protein
VVRTSEEAAFAGFVRSRYGSLLRYAVLLTADRGHAEDLVQDGLARTYGAWGRLAAPEAADAYTRTTLARLAVRGRRRRWRGETPTAAPPDRAGPGRPVADGSDLPTEAAADLLSLHGWPRAVPYAKASWTVVYRGDSGLLVAAVRGEKTRYLPIHRDAGYNWIAGPPCTPA